MKERNEEQASERRETYQKRTRILATKIELTICIEINIIRPSVENKGREMELTGGQQIIKQLHKKKFRFRRKTRLCLLTLFERYYQLRIDAARL